MQTSKTTLHTIYRPSQPVLFAPYYPGGGWGRSVEETPVRGLCDSPQRLGLLVRTTNISHLFLPLSRTPPPIRSICACMAALQCVAHMTTCALKRLIYMMVCAWKDYIILLPIKVYCPLKCFCVRYHRNTKESSVFIFYSKMGSF